ncbi:MAG: anti-sigma factor family protein [Planctomycetota bacterium]|jgi:ferric-dicitrate binding protein FerR (iron transport regulator)
MNREHLYAYLDGELPPGDRARFEQKLAADASLAAELERVRFADRALDTLPGHDAPADFTRRVLLAARRGVPLAAAAAILVAVLFSQSSTPGERHDVFSTQDHLDYVWEVDAETYGSMTLEDLEDQILEELELT